MAQLRLQAKFDADGSGFFNTLSRADRGVMRFGQNIKNYVAGAFTIGAIAGFSRGVFNLTQDIKDAAERWGTTIREAQAMMFAAPGQGDTISKALDKIAENKVDIMSGANNAEKLADAFAKLGVSLRDIFQKSPIEIFRQIADRLSDTNVNAQTTAALMDTMGKNGSKLVPVMKDLRANLEAFSKPIMSESDIKRLDAMAKATDLTKKRVQLEAGSFTSKLFSKDHWSLFLSGGIPEANEAEKRIEALRARLKPKGGGVLDPQIPEGKVVKEDFKDTVKTKLVVQSADQLVRVGNFLGSNRENVVFVAQQQLNQLKIANNFLKLNNELLRSMKFPGMSGGYPP